ncbi:MAG: hypothetical protein SFY92_11180 [Verrucomicrobiae bacterium]|nr:hypothetical protein [Verrucomicrobiae bacterium]
MDAKSNVKLVDCVTGLCLLLIVPGGVFGQEVPPPPAPLSESAPAGPVVAPAQNKPLSFPERIAQARGPDLDQIEVELGQSLRQDTFAATTPDAAWQHRWLMREWVALKKSLETGGPEAPEIREETWRWLVSDPDLSMEFRSNRGTKPRAALLILQELHDRFPERFPAYHSLATAFAWVWSQPLNAQMHGQTGGALIPMDESSVADRFSFYAEGNEALPARLAFDLRKLRAGELKYVVDTPVSLAELQWAQANVKGSREQFERVYSSIRYDEARLNAGQYQWPGADYSLAAIQKNGGICVDQGYFAAVAGKARGIPTLLFTGPGRRGGHAWIGYMKAPGRWEMEVGRYTFDKYATGTTLDPVTRKPITDHELEFLGKGYRQQPQFEASEWLTRAAALRDGNQVAEAVALCDRAIALENRNLEAYWVKAGVLEKSGNGPALEALYKGMVARFSNNADIRTEAQRRLVELYESQGRSAEARQVQDSMVRRNAGERHDLSLEVVRESLRKKVEADDYAGALREYKSATRRFEMETGAMLGLLMDLAAACAARGEVKTARDAVKYSRDNLRFDPITQRQFEKISATVEDQWKNRNKK